MSARNDNDAIMAVVEGWTPLKVEKASRLRQIRTGSTVEWLARRWGISVRAKDRSR